MVIPIDCYFYSPKHADCWHKQTSMLIIAYDTGIKKQKFSKTQCKKNPLAFADSPSAYHTGMAVAIIFLGIAVVYVYAFLICNPDILRQGLRIAKKRKQAPTNTLQSPSIPEADADYRLDIPEWKMKKIQAILDDASLSDDEKELKIAIEVG